LEQIILKRTLDDLANRVGESLLQSLLHACDAQEFTIGNAAVLEEVTCHELQLPLSRSQVANDLLVVRNGRPEALEDGKSTDSDLYAVHRVVAKACRGWL